MFSSEGLQFSRSCLRCILDAYLRTSSETVFHDGIVQQNGDRANIQNRLSCQHHRPFSILLICDASYRRQPFWLIHCTFSPHLQVRVPPDDFCNPGKYQSVISLLKILPIKTALRVDLSLTTYRLWAGRSSAPGAGHKFFSS